MGDRPNADRRQAETVASTLDALLALRDQLRDLNVRLEYLRLMLRLKRRRG
jgi:hypothetical protein